jgi:hypothetical protein
MSTATDRADAETLAYIGRNPGCKRTNGRCHANASINVAAANRLIRAGLVAWPAGNGKLYLTERGAELHWAPTAQCRHCFRSITPTEFGTWQDADNPGYEVCDLADDSGPSHEPAFAASR